MSFLSPAKAVVPCITKREYWAARRCVDLRCTCDLSMKPNFRPHGELDDRDIQMTRPASLGIFLVNQMAFKILRAGTKSLFIYITVNVLLFKITYGQPMEGAARTLNNAPKFADKEGQALTMPRSELTASQTESPAEPVFPNSSQAVHTRPIDSSNDFVEYYPAQYTPPTVQPPQGPQHWAGGGYRSYGYQDYPPYNYMPSGPAPPFVWQHPPVEAYGPYTAYHSQARSQSRIIPLAPGPDAILEVVTRTPLFQILPRGFTPEIGHTHIRPPFFRPDLHFSNQPNRVETQYQKTSDSRNLVNSNKSESRLNIKNKVRITDPKAVTRKLDQQTEMVAQGKIRLDKKEKPVMENLSNSKTIDLNSREQSLVNNLESVPSVAAQMHHSSSTSESTTRKIQVGSTINVEGGKDALTRLNHSIRHELDEGIKEDIILKQKIIQEEKSEAEPTKTIGQGKKNSQSQIESPNGLQVFSRCNGSRGSDRSKNPSIFLPEILPTLSRESCNELTTSPEHLSLEKKQLDSSISSELPWQLVKSKHSRKKGKLQEVTKIQSNITGEHRTLENCESGGRSSEISDALKRAAETSTKRNSFHESGKEMTLNKGEDLGQSEESIKIFKQVKDETTFTPETTGFDSSEINMKKDEFVESKGNEEETKRTGSISGISPPHKKLGVSDTTEGWESETIRYDEVLAAAHFGIPLDDIAKLNYQARLERQLLLKRTRNKHKISSQHSYWPKKLHPDHTLNIALEDYKNYFDLLGIYVPALKNVAKISGNHYDRM
ncbi:hypothetical protein CROQUDRAFT_93385 [Cronartium quercuum f. sp. fusiforme G11]|uniref:Uncharacterized protein n=1 Tax=Cronartium quercuum f. sp. fusiforme G11 TaxID=708437 RepID=A0A9P6TBL7_9BASI|nr:hypothetical protein CROQUDRAFT_93385 [Cronartium quercuum f. sp. fusiforme G11]